MLAPTAMSFSALVATSGFCFIVWHVWRFDKFRCLWSFKGDGDWFRAVMVHVLLLSILSLMAFTWIEVYVLYDVFYASIGGKVQPVPWQLWDSRHHELWKASIYCLAVGWGFLQAIHLEEFLYWGYLISSIRVPGGNKTTWMKSGFFKAWIVAVISGFALLIGATSIETDNMDMMKAYLFMVGSGMSVILAMASIALCMAFPSFIRAVQQQGAPAEVLARLSFFNEMNGGRTVFRMIYTICFMILSADAVTPRKAVNRNAFASDFLFLIGQLALFASTLISVVVLLPRNMVTESLPVGGGGDGATFHPLVSYKRTAAAAAGGGGRQYIELGDRLNVDREALAGLGQETMEMSLSPGARQPVFGVPEIKVDGPGTHEAPFSQAADRTKRARLSELPVLPAVVQKFRSPFDVDQEEDVRKQPTQIYVTTEQTVQRDD